ncbi:protein PF3D7_1417600-like [Cydia splendana]|uniref:protein PF3D7_1417600-like n=1 Tax=Cydia splendana TaxID=1100963 RepID=UPI00300DA158
MKIKYCTKVVDCLSGTHVMCLYGNKTIMGPRCSGGKMLPLTEDEKTMVLDILNEFKRNLAQGKENLPKAYGMRKLFWHDSLAEFAQAWANQCDGGRHDLCRASEEFPSAGQAMYTVRFNYPDWSLQDVQFKDKSKTLTPEKRAQVIESFTEAIYDTSDDVNQQQIENYPSGDFNVKYLMAVHGTTTNVGCGMSSFHDYYRTTDNNPIIFHAVIIVCNFSSQPKEGEKVYETKWSDGEGWTTCGCPDGFIEDDCLCVPGKLPDHKNDTQSENRYGQQNKDKDDQQNKDKDDQQNKDKDDQQNKDKDDQQNKDKDDQQNKDKDDQQNKDKDGQQNKDKDDQQNKDKDDQQNKDKDDQQNKDKNGQQNITEDKNDQGTCNRDDPSCSPRIVLMPIITVENADPDRLNEAEMIALPNHLAQLAQRKQQLRQKIKDRIQNVRDRYFKNYVVLEPGTRFSNGGPIDEDMFVLSKNNPSYATNMNHRKLNNFGTNAIRRNIKIKDRRDFSDLDQLVSEYLLNLHDDKAMDSTADMTDRSVHRMRENNINAKESNTQNYNPSTLNLQDDAQGYRKAISNPDYAIEDHLNNDYEPRTMERQRNILPETEHNPLNIQADDTNNYDYQLYSENNQEYGNVNPRYVVEDYPGFQNDEKFDERGREHNRQLIYDANEITHYYLDRLNENTNTGQQLDTETLRGYRVDTGTDTKHRYEHRRPLHYEIKTRKFQRHPQNDGGEMKHHKPRYYVPDRANL